MIRGGRPPEKKIEKSCITGLTRAGTGKTYASAFALREEAVKKVLFLVHREQIAKQAIASYKKVFGNTRTFGLLSGNSKDFDADYLFSTMQMMAKPEILSKFQRDEFETIIIEEAHRTGATSYQNIMRYFTPKFWLGMTASPERTDSFDVYEAFDHNIAYEIRLQQALEETLLCPFHYFGITDLQIDGETVDEETGLKDFNKLTCDERVDYVIEQMEYYGYCGRCPKGLIFCSSKKEASTLSEQTVINTEYQTEIDKLKEISEKSITGVITTNYDSFLEDIFSGFTKYVGQSQLIFSAIQGIAEIYKIHGSVELPDSLVINEEDYLRFQEKAHISRQNL